MKGARPPVAAVALPAFPDAPQPASQEARYGKDPQKSAGIYLQPGFSKSSNTRELVCQVLCIFWRGDPKLSSDI